MAVAVSDRLTDEYWREHLVDGRLRHSVGEGKAVIASIDAIKLSILIGGH